jgi:hypothetical protein
MNMIKPSPYEKNRTIEDILSKGLSKPKSLWNYIHEIYHALGLRYIFMGTAPAILMTVAAILAWIRLFPFAPEQHPYATLFALAPAFFLVMVCITETIERVGGLYEIKMTCKYTIQQITAFRVLCFSLMGAVFCTLTSLYFSRLPVDYSFFKALSISFCALFLCAVLTLVILRLFNRLWMYLSAILLWLTIGILPVRFFGRSWELLLAQIPIAETLFVTVMVCALFLIEIKKHMKIHKREVAYYAGR